MDINYSYWQLAWKYGESVAKTKSNLQGQALAKYIKNHDVTKEFHKINCNEENVLQSFMVAPDYVFKNSSAALRKLQLISPLGYIYYTYLVIRLDSELNGLKITTNCFYSGEINHREFLEKNAKYYDSYKKFQIERSKLLGDVLQIDLQTFFDTISIYKLIKKMTNKGISYELTTAFRLFFENIGVLSLPQFHLSVASSYLSQFYLQEFDEQYQALADEYSCQMIRFVDDMYFSFPENINSVDLNKFKYELMSLLHNDDLILNLNKTKFYQQDEFQELHQNNKLEESVFAYDDRIEEKCLELVNDPEHKKLKKFIEEIFLIYKENGLSFESFEETVVSTFKTIDNDDAHKVFGAVWRDRKYRKHLYEDDELIQMMLNQYSYIFTNHKLLFSFLLDAVKVYEARNNCKTRIIPRILNYVFTNKMHSGEIILATTYLMKRNWKHDDLIKLLHNQADNKHVEFLKQYILD